MTPWAWLRRRLGSASQEASAASRDILNQAVERANRQATEAERIIIASRQAGRKVIDFPVESDLFPERRVRP